MSGQQALQRSSWGKGVCLLLRTATVMGGWGQSSREAGSPPRKGVKVGGSRVLPPPPLPLLSPLLQPPGSPRGTGPPSSIPTRPPSLPPHSPSLASLLINIEFGRCFGMERGQRPGTPLQLGTLGCCLSRPRGLIPGDTLPPLPAAVSFHPSARPGAVGPLLGVASLPARDQRAGRAQGRKASSLLRVSRRGRGSCWLSCPWQDRVLAAGCPGGCPGAGPAPQKVTAQGGCGGWQPSALFGHWIRSE